MSKSSSPPPSPSTAPPADKTETTATSKMETETTKTVKPPAKTKPKPKGQPKTPRKWMIRNLMMQKINVNVVDAQGNQVGYEIPARGIKSLAFVPGGLGPDVEAKKAKKLIAVYQEE